MKKIIRLTEGDIHHMVRRAINEVLDGMDDTEKSYWLMRQRQQRPNTKSRTKTDYPAEFAKKFNKEVYGNENGSSGLEYLDDENGSGSVYYGSGVHPGNGSFNAGQGSLNHTNPDRMNFDYWQGPNERNGEFLMYPKNVRVPAKASDVYMSPKSEHNFYKGLHRYNDISNTYDIYNRRRAKTSKY